MARSARCTPANRTRRVALLLAPVVGVLAVPAAPAAAQPEGDDVIVRPVKGGRWYREIGLVWRQGAGRAPAFQLIAEHLRAVAS